MADGLARQIAGLTGDIRNLGKRIPSYQRGVVANVSPPTVVMDRDVTATPRPVADVLVPGLAVGQRVEVRVIGSRRVITSIHPADNEPYVQAGTATITNPGSSGGSVAVTFAKPFRGVPVVVMSPMTTNASIRTTGVFGVSETGFTAWAVRDLAGNVTISYIAVYQP